MRLVGVEEQEPITLRSPAEPVPFFVIEHGLVLPEKELAVESAAAAKVVNASIDRAAGGPLGQQGREGCVVGVVTGRPADQDVVAGRA